MGRRSINTTKSGKFMNPTDQARKEARKRELKKNKKQRQMVRAAVLKGKDPQQLIFELEKIDQMEYNVNCPPPLNEKVLKDKRKKLRETWERVTRLYYKEDPDRWEELRRLEIEYEKKKAAMVRFYESVKFAQHVSIDQIPLPDQPMSHDAAGLLAPSMIPLPNEENCDININLHSILKRPQIDKQALANARRVPGVPAGPPPELSDDEDDDIYATLESAVDALDTENTRTKTRKIRFADDSADEPTKKSTNDNISDIPIPQQLPPGPPPGLPPRPPPGPPPIMFRPPPMRMPRMGPPPMSMGVVRPPGVLPPGPPPGLPRVGMPTPLQQQQHMRLPPGPPPGMPPPRMMRPPNISTLAMSALQQQNSRPIIVGGGGQMGGGGQAVAASAPPSLIQRPNKQSSSGGQGQMGGQDNEEKRSATTIEAKPQLRSLSAEVTKFTPTTLRIKREDKLKKGTSKYGEPMDHLVSSHHQSSHMAAAPTKDDTYEQFMKEMQGLI